jgi:HK97 family phage major capsid protein
MGLTAADLERTRAENRARLQRWMRRTGEPVTSALAAEIVHEAAERGRNRSSYAEFRSASAAGREVMRSRDEVFWKYLTDGNATFQVAPGAARTPLFTDGEYRVLSKATSAAGGYLVPQDFDDQITSARRARNVIGEIARNLETDHGRAIPLPTATAHGTGAWTAENAGVTASDETFGQVSVNAFKAVTKTIVSEELARDALDDFDSFLADELGQRLALLEEAAFAVGDGAGKPLGITTSTNGVSTVAAATGSTTVFTLADFKAAFAALPAAYSANASWIMSPSAFLNASGAADTAGAPRLPSLHGDAPALFGRPLYISPELPVAAASARSVVVGDFKTGYAVRRVRGLGVQRQDELHSDSGQIGYRLFERVDGRVVIADASRILTNSAT